MRVRSVRAELFKWAARCTGCRGRAVGGGQADIVKLGCEYVVLRLMRGSAQR